VNGRNPVGLAVPDLGVAGADGKLKNSPPAAHRKKGPERKYAQTPLVTPEATVRKLERRP